MNIWMINQYARSPREWGGTRHFSFAKELIRRGHEVTLVLSDSSCPNGQELKTKATRKRSRSEDIEKVHFIWLDTPKYSGNSWGRVQNMFVFAARCFNGSCFDGLRRPDVIVGSSPHPFAALAAERVAHRFQVPFVLEIRDLWPRSLVDVAKVSPRHPFVLLLGMLEQYLYRRADRIITLLRHAGEYMVRHGARPEKIVWISNGIDISLVAPSHPRSNGRFTVMYAGAHGIANNLDAILDAALVLKNERELEFRFLGEGTEKKRLMKRVEQEQIKNVSFEAPVPKAAIYMKLQEADAFIATAQALPLYELGISFNKLFDYMASARPIIFGGLAPNAATEANAALAADVRDPYELARAILYIRDMPELERWQMGLRAREHVEKFYSIENLAARLEAVLADAVTAAAARFEVEPTTPLPALK